MSALTDRLNKKRQETGNGSAISKFKSNTTTNVKSGSLASKFSKRSSNVLDKTYEERENRSKAGGMGRPIFEREIMEEFNITEFQPLAIMGDRFFEILPISFSPDMPYFRETCVHFAVGFAQDAFICPHRFLGAKCYRCEVQQKLFRINKAVNDEIKALYPSDRAVYLLWERTKELLEEEEPDFSLQLWNAPKKKVHKKIQDLTRDKLKRTTLDIADVTTDEGRTVGMTVGKQGSFPEYDGFELHVRSAPIPEEILEQIEVILITAEERGYLKHAIDMFFHIPDYDEIKESMLTEEKEAETEGDDEEHQKRFPRQEDNQESQESSNVKTVEDSEKEIATFCIELEKELKEKNSFTFNKWCKENEYPEAVGMDKEEAVEAIVEDVYAKLMKESDIPY